MGMRTDGIGVEFSKSWKHTTLESFCLDQEIYVVVGRDKMPGPDATKEGRQNGSHPQKGTWPLRIDNLWDAGADGGNL